ncbi:uncharacterized protein LOC106668770 [Cimex lectularius]|uniref:HCLS1-associated protein X-1 n=1 Tax=Cimex lectularius TaxID=79782 RepID=A0A8I6S0H7_CIMLE|nr:uncharacterized protein LOC106668770 [Cimex lectularius]
MPIYDFFRKVVGLPAQIPRDRQDGIKPGFKNPIWGEDDDDDDDELDEDFRGFSASSPFHFSVFTGDFFDMHKYFEQQMDDMLKIFGDFGFGDLENKGDRHFPDDYAPANKEENSIRSQFVKPSFERQLNRKSQKIDSDLDGNFDSSVFDLIPDANKHDVIPFNRHLNPTHFFGQSVISRSVTRPNGTLEHFKTIKKSDGSEEVTVTRQIGDKKHTVITVTSREGLVEKKEEFVNMDKESIGEFEAQWGSNGINTNFRPADEGQSRHWPIFSIFKNMYFK